MKDLLTYFEKFLPLSSTSRNLILQTSECIQFKKHEKIIYAGEQSKYIYILKSGLVRGYKILKGNEITTFIWMENEIFGDIITYISNERSQNTYEALEYVEVYRIDITKFKSLFISSHEICNLGRMMAESYIYKTETLKEILRHNCADEKFQLFLKHRPGLISRTKLKYIASFIAISPETLSRIRNLVLQN